jgi:hypothetical protein
MTLKQVFLIGACASVIAVALCYGLAPSWFARAFLGIGELPTDIKHVLRAVMGLYLALGLYWGWAAFNREQADAAVVSILVFNAGLLAGRVVSIVADGMPAMIFLAYAAIEFTVLPVACWVLRRPA